MRAYSALSCRHRCSQRCPHCADLTPPSLRPGTRSRSSSLSAATLRPSPSPAQRAGEAATTAGERTRRRLCSGRTSTPSLLPSRPCRDLPLGLLPSMAATARSLPCLPRPSCPAARCSLSPTTRRTASQSSCAARRCSSSRHRSQSDRCALCSSAALPSRCRQPRKQLLHSTSGGARCCPSPSMLPPSSSSRRSPSLRPPSRRHSLHPRCHCCRCPPPDSLYALSTSLSLIQR